MTMNPLPPQAYTKETLLKAYQWLTVQNSSIKEMATTPDILVSLYLKATRDGDHALDRPSIQNFKNELKSLAGMMGELDGPSSRPAMTSRQSQVVTPVQQVQQVQQVHVVPTPAAATATQTQVSYTEKTVTATTLQPDLMSLLDSCSQGMIQEVKDEFNLSSDLEALRMLIKVGYSRSKVLLK
ncbi:MAG: hypothetical protein OM95_04510 [Bdellovibrio sp. ArHS]|uniref:hypothetical protein n=1 Tax=Bdellovibrio sp. ArHS TaxID=1569284 RepID=UPI00058384D4|nr:hypothetical protein [Bdellovibrio sp. ArHS]KHD89101.1 MAG: hypothetical protein OM95_04510 [Bdellovibrio sp. ArHS]